MGVVSSINNQRLLNQILINYRYLCFLIYLTINLLLIPCSIHLSLVIDLDFNFDFARYGSEASELSLLVVVVGGVELCVLVGQLDGPD